MFLQVVTHVNTITDDIGVAGQKPDQAVMTGLEIPTEVPTMIPTEVPTMIPTETQEVVSDEPGIVTDEFGFDGQIGGDGIVAEEQESIAEKHGVNAVELAEKMSLLNAAVSNFVINL